MPCACMAFNGNKYTASGNHTCTEARDTIPTPYAAIALCIFKYKKILSEKVSAWYYYIRFEGNGGVKRKETRDWRYNNSVFICLALCIERHYIYVAKLADIRIVIVSPIPCLLPFYTSTAFKSNIPLTFSERMFVLFIF